MENQPLASNPASTNLTRHIGSRSCSAPLVSRIPAARVLRFGHTGAKFGENRNFALLRPPSMPYSWLLWLKQCALWALVVMNAGIVVAGA